MRIMTETTPNKQAQPYSQANNLFKQQSFKITHDKKTLNNNLNVISSDS